MDDDAEAAEVVSKLCKLGKKKKDAEQKLQKKFNKITTDTIQFHVDLDGELLRCELDHSESDNRTKLWVCLLDLAKLLKYPNPSMQVNNWRKKTFESEPRHIRDVSWDPSFGAGGKWVTDAEGVSWCLATAKSWQGPLAYRLIADAEELQFLQPLAPPPVSFESAITERIRTKYPTHEWVSHLFVSPYRIDVACEELMLAVEIDEAHEYYDPKKEAKRAQDLQKRGWCLERVNPFKTKDLDDWINETLKERIDTLQQALQEEAKKGKKSTPKRKRGDPTQKLLERSPVSDSRDTSLDASKSPPSKSPRRHSREPSEDAASDTSPANKSEKRRKKRT